MDVYDNPLKAETIRYIFNNSDLGKYAPKDDFYAHINDEKALIDFSLKKIWFSGKKDEGEVKKWHQNGLLHYHYFLKNGERDGEFKQWHDNGQLFIHCFYKDGKLHGKSESYWENGKLMTLKNYVDGTECGDYYQWDKNGKLVIHLKKKC
jgi:antitoxin component YwqK of YwqJK toxin-antitoxin module